MPAVRVFVGWLVCMVLLPSIVVVLACTPRQRRLTRGPAMARLWGRVMLAISGVKLEVTPAAQALAGGATPCIMTLNHTSTLDVLVGGAYYPPHCVVVAKAEFRKVPLLGAAGALVGMIFIDRRDGRGARASLLAAAEQIVRDRLVVLIAPEGTRTRDGGMPPFKTGAFALAQAADVPVIPLVWHGCRELWPMGAFGPKPGKVVIDALPAFRVGPGEEGPRLAAEQLRLAYLQALGRADA